jgi:amidase
MDTSAIFELALNEQIMLTDGVIARHVGDVRRGLEIVMGAHRADPQSVDVPLHGSPVSKRVALVPEPFGGETDPEIAEGVRRAGRALADAGYEVEEVEPPKVFDSYIAWAELMTTSMAASELDLTTVIGEDGLRFLELSTADFPPATAESIGRLHQTRFGIARAWREFFMIYPLVVGPTWTQSPFPLGFDIKDAESAMKVLEMVRFVLPANLLGLPAACVPVGLANDLPTGVQVIGDMFRDDLCLNAAEVIEQSLGALTPIDPR